MDVETTIIGILVVGFIVFGIVASRRVDRQLKAMSEAERLEREKTQATARGKKKS